MSTLCYTALPYRNAKSLINKYPLFSIRSSDPDKTMRSPDVFVIDCEKRKLKYIIDMGKYVIIN